MTLLATKTESKRRKRNIPALLGPTRVSHPGHLAFPEKKEKKD